MRSRVGIRVKLTAAFAAAMLVVLALAGVFVYFQVKSSLDETLDENLQARADDVASVAVAPGRIELESQRLVESEDAFAQVLQAGPDARIIASTLPAGTGAVLSAEEATRASESPTFLDEREVPGIAGEARTLARPVTTNNGASRIVVVGATTEDREETLSGLRWSFLIGAPAALILASLLGYFLAGRALAPVEDMRRRAGEITLERSGERLPLPRAEDEIHDLGQTLNTMLDRIEASLERERVFVSDASHELRTPLANLRAELELANREGRSPDEMRAALRSAADETERLTQLAEDLLVIARSDQGRLPIKREPTDLGTLLDRVRVRFSRRAEQSGRRISVDATEGVEADVDPLRLEQALGNLVDNALRHGGGDVVMKAASNGAEVTLDVSDSGPGFPPGFTGQAFERFTRADQGRTGGGAGLGLAIVRAIAAAHGGGTEIVAGANGATTVRISLSA